MKMEVTIEVKNVEKWLKNKKQRHGTSFKFCLNYRQIYNRLCCLGSGINIQNYRPAKDGKQHAR